MSSRTTQVPERSVADVLMEIKDELRDFVETRYDLLRSELHEALSTVKSAAPLAVAAADFFRHGVFSAYPGAGGGYRRRILEQPLSLVFRVSDRGCRVGNNRRNSCFPGAQ